MIISSAFEIAINGKTITAVVVYTFERKSFLNKVFSKHLCYRDNTLFVIDKMEEFDDDELCDQKYTLDYIVAHNAVISHVDKFLKLEQDEQ